MARFFYILFLFNFSFYFSQVNIEEIKKNVSEDPQTYFYDYVEIFKKDPLQLTQEQMNQLYYGSRFIKFEEDLSDHSKNFKEIWEPASRKNISKKKAEKIVVKAEETYSKYPFDRDVLIGLSNIYYALGDQVKGKLFENQHDAIENTINNSGTGSSADSPICVIWPGDVLKNIKNLQGYGSPEDFQQNFKMLPDGSILTIYSMGEKKIFVKLVGGFRFE